MKPQFFQSCSRKLQILAWVVFLNFSLTATALAQNISNEPAAIGSKTMASSQLTEDRLSLQTQRLHKDLHDHLAKVFEIKGEARILKSGSDTWGSLQMNTIIEAGDQILTEEKSQVRIAYDDHFLNIAVIKERTKVEFRSIEPTDIRLVDGWIFNVADKLEGDTYQISTPTAVAAVHGTHFEIGYNEQTGAFNAELFPDGDDLSHLAVKDIVRGQEGPSLELSEGQRLVAENDDTPFSVDSVQPMTDEEVREYHGQLDETLETVDKDKRLEILAESESEISTDTIETTSTEEESLRNSPSSHSDDPDRGDLDNELESASSENEFESESSELSADWPGETVEALTESILDTEFTQELMSELDEPSVELPEPEETPPPDEPEQ